MADRVGQRLGNYRLERLLGKGGFAEVYLGTHIHLGTQAAIKVLHTQLASAEDVEKFRVEARTIATLVHPHIVRVLDFNVEDETPFLVMDYAPNGSLRQQLPQGRPLPPATILPYVKQVAEALQYAHDQRLIHRDVKQENMLLGRNNEVLLSDFGIALVAQSTSRDEGTQGIAGTTTYMAPEQLQGHPRPASDQYALGVVVYQWLSGDPPFHGSYIEVASQHVLAAPRPLRQKVPLLSPGLEQVVMVALAKDPKDRFASIRAFANAFERACQYDQASATLTPPGVFVQPTVFITQPERATPPIAFTPPNVSTQPTVLITPPGPSAPPGWISAPSPSMDPTFGQPSPRFPIPPSESMPPGRSAPPRQGISRRVFVLGLAGTAVGGGALAWLFLSHQSQPTGAAKSPTATAPVGATMSPSPTSQADPTATTPAPPIGTLLYLYRGHTTFVNGVAWSPDNKRIASASWDGTVQVWDADNGGNPLVYRGHSREVNAVAWSPDGTRIASGSFDKTVQVWDATTGRTLLTYSGHTDFVNAVAWSHDGQHIASGSGMAVPNRTPATDTSVRVWDARTGSTLYTYTGHSDSVTTTAWSPDNQRIASGSWDHSVQVWDALTGGNGFSYPGHSDHVWAAPWSPDGRRIASGSKDHTVQVWDAANGGNVLTYPGHTDTVFAVAWSPNGQRVASGSRDQTVQLWNPLNGSTLFTYRGHSGNVNGVAWSVDSTRIASVGDDKTVQVWQAQ